MSETNANMNMSTNTDEDTTSAMTVSVNGDDMTLPADATVVDLVARLGLAGKTVAVEVNRDVVPRATHAEHRLRPGDRIEVVSFVGGG